MPQSLSVEYGEHILRSYPDGFCPESQVLRLILDMLLGNENDLYIRHEVYQRNDDVQLSSADLNLKNMLEWKFIVSFTGQNIKIKKSNLKSPGLSSMLKWFAELGAMLLTCRNSYSMCNKGAINNNNNDDVRFNAILDFIQCIDRKLRFIYEEVIVINSHSDTVNEMNCTVSVQVSHAESLKATSLLNQDLLFSPAEFQPIIDSSPLVLATSMNSASVIADATFSPSSMLHSPTSSLVSLSRTRKVDSLLSLFQVCRSWKATAQSVYIWTKQIILEQNTTMTHSQNHRHTKKQQQQTRQDEELEKGEERGEKSKEEYLKSIQHQAYSNVLMEKIERQVQLADMTFVSTSFSPFSSLSSSSAVARITHDSVCVRAFFHTIYNQLFLSEFKQRFHNNSAARNRNVESSSITMSSNSSMNSVSGSQSTGVISASSSHAVFLLNQFSIHTGSNVYMKPSAVERSQLDRSVTETLRTFTRIALVSSVEAPGTISNIASNIRHNSVCSISSNMATAAGTSSSTVQLRSLSAWSAVMNSNNTFMNILNDTLPPFTPTIAHTTFSSSSSLLSSSSILVNTNNKASYNISTLKSALYELSDGYKATNDSNTEAVLISGNGSSAIGGNNSLGYSHHQFRHPTWLIQQTASQSYKLQQNSQQFSSSSMLPINSATTASSNNSNNNKLTHASPYVQTAILPSSYQHSSSSVSEDTDNDNDDDEEEEIKEEQNKLVDCNNGDNNDYESTNTYSKAVLPQNQHNQKQQQEQPMKNDSKTYSHIDLQISQKIVQYFVPSSLFIQLLLTQPIATTLLSLEHTHTRRILFDQGNLREMARIMQDIYCLANTTVFSDFYDSSLWMEEHTASAASTTRSAEKNSRDNYCYSNRSRAIAGDSDFDLLWMSISDVSNNGNNNNSNNSSFTMNTSIDMNTSVDGSAYNNDYRNHSNRKQVSITQRLARLIRRLNYSLTPRLQNVLSSSTSSSPSFSSDVSSVDSMCVLFSSNHFSLPIPPTTESSSAARVENKENISTDHSTTGKSSSISSPCIALALCQQINIELKIFPPVSVIITNEIQKLYTDLLRHILPLSALKSVLLHLWRVSIKHSNKYCYNYKNTKSNNNMTENSSGSNNNSSKRLSGNSTSSSGSNKGLKKIVSTSNTIQSISAKSISYDNTTIATQEKAAASASEVAAINNNHRQCHTSLFLLTKAVTGLYSHYLTAMNHFALAPLQQILFEAHGDMMTNNNNSNNSASNNKFTVGNVRELYIQCARYLQVLLNICQQEVKCFIQDSFAAIVLLRHHIISISSSSSSSSTSSYSLDEDRGKDEEKAGLVEPYTATCTATSKTPTAYTPEVLHSLHDACESMFQLVRTVRELQIKCVSGENDVVGVDQAYFQIIDSLDSAFNGIQLP